jgi:hypothetical protein
MKAIVFEEPKPEQYEKVKKLLKEEE